MEGDCSGRRRWSAGASPDPRSSRGWRDDQRNEQSGVTCGADPEQHRPHESSWAERVPTSCRRCVFYTRGVQESMAPCSIIRLSTRALIAKLVCEERIMKLSKIAL